MITHLFLKPSPKMPLEAVDNVKVSADRGMDGNIPCSPFRQILIVTQESLDQFNLQPGDLRENMIVQGIDLYALPSGTVIQIGDAKIRLTFLCEPCSRIGDKVNLKAITGHRGYLGQFLNEGAIKVGDTFAVTDQVMEAIPYKSAERIKWFLDKQTTPIQAADLVWQIGLASSYCRALPGIIRKNPEIDPAMVLYRKG